MGLLIHIRKLGQWYSKHYWWILFALIMFGFFSVIVQSKMIMKAAAEEARSKGHNTPSWTLRLESAMGATPFYTWEGANPLIVYFSTECSHCQEIVPELVAKQPSRPLILVASRGSDEESLRNFMRKHIRVVVPVYRDVYGEFANWYGLVVVPRLIDVRQDSISVVVPTPGIFDTLK